MGDLTGGTGLLGKVLGSRDESWKIRHITEMNRRDSFERFFAAVLERFRLIAKLDELLNAGWACGSISYDAEDERELSQYYRTWLETAEPVARELKKYRLAGFLMTGSNEFLVHLENARGICTPDEEFFAGENLEELRDAAVDAYQADKTIEIRSSRD